MNYVIAAYRNYSVRIDCANEREAAAHFADQKSRRDVCCVVVYTNGVLQDIHAPDLPFRTISLS